MNNKESYNRLIDHLKKENLLDSIIIKYRIKCTTSIREEDYMKECICDNIINIIKSCDRLILPNLQDIL